MLRKNLIIAFRYLRQQPVYSIILIGGLTIGLAASLLVSTLVINDLSYDQQWSKKDQIYRVITQGTSMGGEAVGCLNGLTPELKKSMPEVEDYCRMRTRDVRLLLGQDPQGISFNSLEAESSIWNFLDLDIMEGSPKQEVHGYDNLLITESVRKKFFANKNPVGMQIRTVNTYNAGDTFLITGVIKDLPKNTHLRADVIVLRQFSEGNNILSGPGAGNFEHAYVLLKPETNLQKFTSKVNSWFKSRMKENWKSTYLFQPMKDIYLRTPYNNQQNIIGDIYRVYILSGVSVMLLLIACINFINLNTASALRRAKGTSIRKVLGAGKSALLKLYITESIICFLIGFILAIFLYLMAQPALESFTGSPLPLGINKQWYILAATCGIVFLITLLTGLYPAWVLSRPQAVLSFNLSGKNNEKGNFFRRTLVIVQFVISIVLLISAFVVHRQVRLLNEMPLGYEKNNMLVMSWMNWGDKANAFRNTVNEISGVQSASISRWVPGGGAASMTAMIQDPRDPKIETLMAFISGDSIFPKTMGFKLLKGRWLNSGSYFDAPDFDSAMRHGGENELEMNQSLLLTESTAQKLGIRELGRHINGLPGIPVGIIADFKNESLKTASGLLGIQGESNVHYGGMLIRVAPGTESHVLKTVNTQFRKFYPSIAQEFETASGLLADQYESESRLMKVFYFFSSLIIFLSCMGLFGLVTFMVQSRVKEIGIRKVLGASVERITTMFTWSFLKLVIVSGIIAIPAGWYLMHRWLEDYPYRIDLSWWIFGLPILTLVILAILTVGVQSVRAAIANPTDALRNE